MVVIIISVKIPFLEITTRIGCKVNCIKYCPQELIVANHKTDCNLTFGTFRHLLSTVPSSVTIQFAGFCEPFLNPDCSDMILWAYAKGHPVQIYSTLVGLTIEDADRILDIPFEHFELHLPDAEGNATIPITKEYLEVLGMVLSRVHNLSFMNMGGEFTSSGVERLARGTSTIQKYGRVTCRDLRTPNYTMMPNGEVYFCCATRGVAEKVGSLYENTYQELVDKFPQQSRRLQKDERSLCHRCASSEPWLKRELLIRISKIL
jgi:radical SAM protein with 4Fe4S-binding SPASM domain